MRGLAAMVLLLGACSFTPGAVSGDAGDDQPPTVTVGFAGASTLADETSATLSIHVTLSGPSEQAVTVAYATSGGTATKGVDYTETDGTLTFAPGDIDETIEVAIKADGEVESDETIDLALSSPSGATLGQADHVINISANTLPRVSFMTPTSMGAEDTSTTLVVALDTTPLVPVTIDLVGSGTATGGGTDYTLSTTTLTFDAGTSALTQTVSLTVNNDLLDENDEDAIVDFANGVNVIVASTNATRTHQIQDNDLPPAVTFSLGPASSVGEGTAMVDLSVTLDAPSGKDISVDFSVDGASSATGGGTDFSLGTTSPLMFPAGMTSKTIRININNDATVETPETVVITLDNLPTTNVVAGTDTTHTLSITDNDGTCVGSGAYTACFASLNGNTNINADINTDSDGRCVSPAAGWTGQPAACFITGASINVMGGTALVVTGSKPLVLLASGDITLGNSLDASSRRTAPVHTGPAASSSLCAAFSDTPTNGNTGNQSGAGGGAGGTFRSAGGDGGNGGVNTGNSGGTATTAVGAPAVLRGGCAGQNGGTYNGGGAGTGGAGGGAIYIASGGTLKINSGKFVNVSGAGASAAGSGNRGGGAGGGSGGMIKLFATTLTVTGAILVANGGGGSRGGDSNDTGASGADPDPTTPGTTAAGGTSGSGGGLGGNGFFTATQATDGGSSTSNGDDNAGGGGGGGGGHIESNQPMTGATVSAGP